MLRFSSKDSIRHVLGLLAFATFSVGTAATPVAGSERPAAIVASEQFLLRSERIGQTFLIQVARPGAAPPTQKAPVVYVTDGVMSFGVFSSLARTLPLEQLIAPTFIVAISYPPEQAADTQTLRLRDLMHRPTSHRTGVKTNGGGAAFEAFLLEEVKPLIERRYAVDPARSILAGHSLGGLFAANVLANHPDAFAGYVIGSPSVHDDDAVLANIRAVGQRGNSKRVFIGAGELEPPMVQRATALELAFEGSRFVVERRTFANETHTSVLGALASAGLRFVLAEPAPSSD